MSLLNLLRNPKSPEMAPLSEGERLGLMVHRNCPVCHTDDTRELQRLTDFQFFSDGRAPRVDLVDVQCNHCFTLYKNPTYTDRGMDVLFAQASKSYGAEHPAERVKEQAAWMVSHRLADDVFDYGCADGAFLAALPPGRRVGFDIDPIALAKAREAHPDIAFFNLNDARSGFAAFTDPTKVVQTLPHLPRVLTLWHTLEHLEMPGPALRTFEFFPSPMELQIRRPPCWLVVEVPVLEHGFTDDICGFLSPQHTTHFSKTTLKMLLWASGWAPRAITTMPYNGYRVLCDRVPPSPFKGGNSDDVKLANAYLRRHREAVANVDQRFRDGVGDRPYVLWGAGMHTECLYQETSLKQHLPDFIVDSDPAKVRTAWRGIAIEPTSALLDDSICWHHDCAKLIISSYGSQREIKAAALAMGVPEAAIVTLYENPVVY